MLKSPIIMTFPLSKSPFQDSSRKSRNAASPLFGEWYININKNLQFISQIIILIAHQFLSFISVVIILNFALLSTYNKTPPVLLDSELPLTHLYPIICNS